MDGEQDGSLTIGKVDTAGANGLGRDGSPDGNRIDQHGFTRLLVRAIAKPRLRNLVDSVAFFLRRSRALARIRTVWLTGRRPESKESLDRFGPGMALTYPQQFSGWRLTGTWAPQRSGRVCWPVEPHCSRGNRHEAKRPEEARIAHQYDRAGICCIHRRQARSAESPAKSTALQLRFDGDWPQQQGCSSHRGGNLPQQAGTDQVTGSIVPGNMRELWHKPGPVPKARGRLGVTSGAKRTIHQGIEVTCRRSECGQREDLRNATHGLRQMRRPSVSGKRCFSKPARQTCWHADAVWSGHAS